MNQILNELVVYAPCNSKRRFGSVPTEPYWVGDGGYVVVDGYTYDQYLGCGVGTNPSFDFQFLETQLNINGLVFDGNISYYPRFPNGVDYVRKNITSTNTSETTNLNNETENFKNIFMKMDIDGYEWNWIKSFNNFRKIKQFVLEVHGLFPEQREGAWDWAADSGFDYVDVCLGLKKINQTHHLVHFHSNDCAWYTEIDGTEMPTVAELTFIRKEDCGIEGLNKIPFPIDGLDFRNSGIDPHTHITKATYERQVLCFSDYPFCSPNRDIRDR